MEGRVLSLQSHVVHGYVGNKSATFPLQVLGLEVDAINSVQFSNHTRYNHWKGQIMNSTQLDELLEGLRLNGLSMNSYSHLLTGYIGSESFLKSVKEAILQLKKDNPSLKYVCDPVMGDNGKMYVPAELLPIYRDDIVPLADVITPNQFEAELLSGLSIKTENDVKAVMTWFHDKGVKTVVLSSTDLGNEEELIGIASSKGEDGSIEQMKISIPRFPVNFTGTGDLFASLLLSWLHKTSHDIKVALENTVATMQTVLTATVSSAVQRLHSRDIGTLSAEERTSLLSSLSPRDIELKLIQCLDSIRSPQPLIRATSLS